MPVPPRRRLEALAAALGPDGQVLDATDDGLVEIGTRHARWRLEAQGRAGDCGFGPGYTVYAVRPAATGSPQVQGLVQLDDDRVFMVGDPVRLQALVDTRTVSTLALGYLVALFATGDGAPRRVLDASTAGPAPAVARVSDGDRVELWTTRLEPTDDPDEVPARVRERWTVHLRPGALSWASVPDPG